MEFNATSTNITELLVASLAVVAAVLLMRKRYDSNLPLLFYFFAILFTNMAADREINPYLLYSGLALALVVRFEFMGSGFAKFVAFCATLSLCLIIWSMMSDVLVS